MSKKTIYAHKASGFNCLFPSIAAQLAVK